MIKKLRIGRRSDIDAEIYPGTNKEKDLEAFLDQFRLEINSLKPSSALRADKGTDDIIDDSSAGAASSRRARIKIH
jgi:hypothetical protein